MTEPGSESIQPKPPHSHQHPFEEEKIENDDLMAILGGVVPPGVSSMETPQPVLAPEPKIETPSVPPVSLEPSIPTAVFSQPPMETPAVSPIASIPPLSKPTVSPEALKSDLESLDSAQELVSDSGPDKVTVESPKPLDALPTPPPVRLGLQEPPSLSEVFPQGAKPTVQLPDSLKPPAMVPGSMFPKSPSAGDDPLGLFKSEPVPTRASTPKDEEELGPVDSKDSVDLSSLQLPRSMPQPHGLPTPMPPFPKADAKPATLGSGASQGDPLHLFDAPSSVSTPKPPVSGPAPMEMPPSPKLTPGPVFPGPGMGLPGMGTATSQEDPLHLFDGPPKRAAEKPMGSSKPPMDDPLHLFDAPVPPSGTPASMAPKPAFTPEDPLGLLGTSGPVAGAVVAAASVAVPSRPEPESLDMMGGSVNAPVAPSKFKNAPNARPVKMQGPSQVSKARSFLAPFLEPLSQKTRVPVFVLELILVLVVLGSVAGLFFATQKPSYQLTDHLDTLRPMRTDVGEVVEFDITAYIDLEGKLKQMGFVPSTKLMVPEIPSPNFFSVFINPSTKTYGIILKMPGVNTPRLSFVNTLQDGTWLSTNGWQAKDKELEKLSSESAPKEEPASLWARHQKRLDQAEVGVSNASDWRFICALSDHLRWFMDLKKIPSYKLAFEDWF